MALSKLVMMPTRVVVSRETYRTLATIRVSAQIPWVVSRAAMHES